MPLSPAQVVSHMLCCKCQHHATARNLGIAFSKETKTRDVRYPDNIPKVHFPLSARALASRRDLEARKSEIVKQTALDWHHPEGDRARVDANVVECLQGGLEEEQGEARSRSPTDQAYYSARDRDALGSGDQQDSDPIATGRPGSSTEAPREGAAAGWRDEWMFEAGKWVRLHHTSRMNLHTPTAEDAPPGA